MRAQLERLIPSAEQGSASSRERPLAVLYGELRRFPPARAVPQQVAHHEADHARARDLAEFSRARIRLPRFPRNHDPAAPAGGARKN